MQIISNIFKKAESALREKVLLKENIEKIFPAMALFFLVITMFAVLFKNDKAAEQAAIWVYYFLCLTVLYHAVFAVYEKYKNYIQKYFFTIYQIVKKYKYLPIIFVTTLITLPWFLSSGYLFFIDFSWGPVIVLDYSSGLAPLFDALHLMGNVMGQDMIQKLFVAGIIYYTLYSGYKIGGNSIALLALFNPFVYDRLMYGQMGVVLAYTFTLNIFYVFLKMYYTQEKNKENKNIEKENLENKNIEKLEVENIKNNIYKISVLYGLSILMSPHFIFINGLLIASFVYYFKDNIKNTIISENLEIKNKKNILGKINNFYKVLAKSFLIILGINIIWISKIFIGTSSTLNYVKSGINENDLSAFATVGDNFFVKTWNIINFSGFWGADFNTYINLSDRTFYFLYPLIIWVVVSFCMYNLYYKNKKLFSVLLFLIISSIVLAQASTLPIIKNILYNIPFYNGMREPQKWVAILVGVILFVISIFIKNTKKIEYKYIISFISIMWVPYLFFGFYGQVKPINYPTYWYDIDKKLTENNCHNGTTAIMPWHMYIKYDWVGKVSANPAINFFACDIITGTNMEWGGIYDNSTDPVGSVISDFVLAKGQKTLPENIKAVLLFKDQDYVSYAFLNRYEKINETDEYVIYKVR